MHERKCAGANKSGGRIDAALGQVEGANERRQVVLGERSGRHIAADGWGGATIGLGWAREDGWRKGAQTGARGHAKGVGRVSAGGRRCERVGAQISTANGRVGASRLRGCGCDKWVE